MKGFFALSAVQSAEPTGLIPLCGKCGLYKTCQSPKMKPYGDGARKILVVGEAPGESEDEEGRPFVGKAGRYLREVLGQIGMRLDRDAWTTNALICRPPHNAAPDKKQIDYCRPNVLATIKEYNPAVIITLGRAALESIIQSYWKDDCGKMERWVGWQIPLANHYVCPTYHPSYLLRMQNSLLDKLFKKHLKAAFKIAEQGVRTIPLPDFSNKVEILYEDSDIYKALRDINHRGTWTAFDYETNCLKPEYPQARIYSAGVSNGERTISYPWTKGAARATGIFLKSERTKKIASNLKFEERWTLQEFGHGVANWGWDTLLGAHVHDNRPHICSLKFQSLVKLGVPSYNDKIKPYLENNGGSHYNRIHEIDLKMLLLYGGIDGFLEHRLAMVQREEMGYYEKD